MVAPETGASLLDTGSLAAMRVSARKDDNSGFRAQASGLRLSGGLARQMRPKRRTNDIHRCRCLVRLEISKSHARGHSRLQA